MNNPELGVIFPAKDIATDRTSLLGFGRAAEAIGMDFITTYDHIVEVDKSRQLAESVTSCDFNSETNVHEAMILFGALAVLTKDIRLITGCLVTPQRQTALIAKQAAEIDILSGGRLTLGISIGWNLPEFEALGAKFHSRVVTLETQMQELRTYWQITPPDQQPHVNTIRPLPVQQPIPIWLGGLSIGAVNRAAKTADG